ncbi:MAG: DUF374 domain-containing protein [Pedosphaera sp.]|nr:DUF374 domain-containing protein [Pedosphaera sp.]
MKESTDQQSTATKARGSVLPEKAQWHGKIAAIFIWALVSCLAATLRWRWIDLESLKTAVNSQRYIFVIWHNRLSLSPIIYRHLMRHRGPNRHLAALVSASKDGGMLTEILKLFRITGIRGSSSRRGAQALRELGTQAGQGRDLALTPDGPRGPRYELKPGVIALAQITGLPIVPISFRLGWKWSLKSWDRFQIPLPFSLCEVQVAKPILVPSDTSESGRESLSLHLKSILTDITHD